MRRIGMLLCAAVLAVSGALTAAGTASAANPYDLQSPYRNYGGWTCADTQEIISAQYIRDRYQNAIQGAVQLRHSRRCDTYWTYVKMYETMASGYYGDARLFRYYNGGGAGHWTCDSPGGNKRISAGRSQCNTGMIYAPSSSVTFISTGVIMRWTGGTWGRIAVGGTAECNQYFCR